MNHEKVFFFFCLWPHQTRTRIHVYTFIPIRYIVNTIISLIINNSVNIKIYDVIISKLHLRADPAGSWCQRYRSFSISRWAILFRIWFCNNETMTCGTALRTTIIEKTVLTVALINNNMIDWYLRAVSW